MKKRKYIYKLSTLSILTVLIGLPSSAGAVAKEAVRLQVTPNPGTVRDVFRVEVIAENFTSAPPHLVIPKEAHSTYLGASSERRNINGKHSYLSTYSFTLEFDKAGNYTLGPAKFSSGHSSEAVTLKVLSSSNATGMPRSGDYFATASLEPPMPFVGQDTDYVVRFHQRIDKNKFPAGLNLSMPGLNGFEVEGSDSQSSYQTVIGGRTYQVTEVRRSIRPSSSGSFEIAAAQFTIGAQRGGVLDIFQRRQRSSTRTIKTNRLKVNITPLPQPEPDDFSGIIGTISVTSTINKKRLRIGESAQWIVEISSDSPLRDFSMPEIEDVPGFRIYPEAAGNNSNHFVYTLVAMTPGRHTLPVITLSTFDPQSQNYRYVQTKSLSLDIVADTSGGSLPRPSIKSPPANNDILTKTQTVPKLHEQTIAAIPFPKHSYFSGVRLPLRLGTSSRQVSYALILFWFLGGIALLTAWRLRSPSWQVLERFRRHLNEKSIADALKCHLIYLGINDVNALSNEALIKEVKHKLKVEEHAYRKNDTIQIEHLKNFLLEDTLRFSPEKIIKKRTSDEKTLARKQSIELAKWLIQRLPRANDNAILTTLAILFFLLFPGGCSDSPKNSSPSSFGAAKNLHYSGHSSEALNGLIEMNMQSDPAWWEAMASILSSTPFFEINGNAPKDKALQKSKRAYIRAYTAQANYLRSPNNYPNAKRYIHLPLSPYFWGSGAVILSFIFCILAGLDLFLAWRIHTQKYMPLALGTLGLSIVFALLFWGSHQILSPSAQAVILTETSGLLLPNTDSGVAWSPSAESMAIVTESFGPWWHLQNSTPKASDNGNTSKRETVSFQSGWFHTNDLFIISNQPKWPQGLHWNAVFEKIKNQQTDLP